MEPSTTLGLGGLLIFFSFILYNVYEYFCGNFHIFRDQGIPGPRPIPIFGTWWRSWEHHPLAIAQQYYEKYGKIYCTFLGRIPVLHVHDVDLLRQILIKDSGEYFGKRSRRPITTGENDYTNKSLAMLHGEEWKILRSLVTGSISSRLIKERFDFVNDSIMEFMKEWKCIAGQNGKMDLRVETEILCEELVMNYSVGMKLGTLGNPNHPFVLSARKTMEAGRNSFLGTMTRLYPKLLQWLSPVLDTGNEYFAQLAKRVLKERSDLNKSTVPHVTLEPDLVDRLLACITGADVKGHQHIDETIAIAQLISTFVAGYDVGTALTRVVHCLTMNPEIQKRCRVEIQDTLEGNGNDSSFMSVNSLSYLEQCIREALRLYPATMMTSRECTKDKQYKNLFIPKGTTVQIPLYMVQRDPELYPNPLKYDPDRFSLDKNSDRDPFHAFSFGQGPRSCFAQSFAIFVLKHCLTNLLPTFEFFPVPQTKDPISFTSGPNGVLTAKDMFVGIKCI